MEPMIERRPGEVVQMDTRGEANETVDRAKRYAQILECLTERPQATAKEIAVMMYRKGYIPTTERNFAAPRLTELCKDGRVEAVGKRRCRFTGKMVSVYAMWRNDEHHIQNDSDRER